MYYNLYNSKGKSCIMRPTYYDNIVRGHRHIIANEFLETALYKPRLPSYQGDTMYVYIQGLRISISTKIPFSSFLIIKLMQLPYM